jgi:uncharacterized membrane protein YphA (DoxX/SURF4 family)
MPGRSRRREILQRLFPSFPSGWPGVGLLLLRAAVGASLAIQGIACFGPGFPGIWTWTLGPLAIGVGAALLIGFLTPMAGGAAVLIGAGIALSLLPPSIPNVLGGAPASILVLLMAAAVVLLGPGAFSLDARLFGRREIVIPQVSRPPDDGA